jgi:hypothetical protein
LQILPFTFKGLRWSASPASAIASLALQAVWQEWIKSISYTAWYNLSAGQFSDALATLDELGFSQPVLQYFLLL